MALAGSRSAAAQTQAALEYRAPASCPTDATFVAEVTARMPRLRRVESEGAPRFVVEVTPLDDGYRGELTSRDPDGTTSTREVSADTCEEVVGALALVLALAIDLRAPPDAPAETPLAVAPTEEPVPEPRAPAVAEALAPSTPAARSRFGGGTGLASTGGIAPAALLGPAIFVEATFGLGPALRPTLRLGAQRAGSGAIEAPNGGSARLTWTVGTLDACPVTWTPAGDRLELSPCARLDAGVLVGSGANVAHPRDSTQAWLDAGLIARAEWAFARPLFADLEGGAVVMVTRPRFHFDAPDVPIRQPAPVGGVAAVALGCRFP